MLRVLDLFSGVGGFSKGFEMAGYRIVAANEIDSEIASSYQYNHPNTKMYNTPISDFVDIAHKYHNKIDVIIGGPPCQGFSMAGSRNRQKKRNDKDPRNMLFEEYLKVVDIVQPSIFIIENVKGMLSLDNGEYYEMVINGLKKLRTKKGTKYNIYSKILRADKFGVPQTRERLIIIASENKIDDSKLETPDPQIAKKYGYEFNNTIYDAISDLNYLESGEKINDKNYLHKPITKYQKFMRKESYHLENHIATKHNEKIINRIEQLSQGENRNNLTESCEIKSIHSGAYGRMEWNGKAKTLITRFDTPSAGPFIHPERNRTITAREAARIQSFPDNFVFYGSKSSVGKQIGNAVPPLLALYIAEIIKE